MKKSRGQDWMNRHNSTQQEIEARIIAAQRKLNDRLNDINKRMAGRIRGVSEEQGIDALKLQFKSNVKIDHYKWTCEYSFQPGRRCFASGSLILPGTTAYKGNQNYNKTGRTNKDGFFIDVNIYPEIIWLTKGEFTMRKLKGQL